jgi:hypothetical protein
LAFGRPIAIGISPIQPLGWVVRRDTLTTFAGIISMWRDEAAHGAASPLSTANADEGLRQLLHMCQWVHREWDELMR